MTFAFREGSPVEGAESRENNTGLHADETPPRGRVRAASSVLDEAMVVRLSGHSGPTDKESRPDAGRLRTVNNFQSVGPRSLPRKTKDAVSVAEYDPWIAPSTGATV